MGVIFLLPSDRDCLMCVSFWAVCRAKLSFFLSSRLGVAEHDIVSLCVCVLRIEYASLCSSEARSTLPKSVPLPRGVRFFSHCSAPPRPPPRRPHGFEYRTPFDQTRPSQKSQGQWAGGVATLINYFEVVPLFLKAWTFDVHPLLDFQIRTLPALNLFIMLTHGTPNKYHLIPNWLKSEKGGLDQGGEGCIRSILFESMSPLAPPAP